MSPKQKKIFYRDRSVGFASSVLLHAVVMIGGGLVFAQGAQYAVEAGTGGIEVSLVAAPQESAVTEMIGVPEPPKESLPAPKPDDRPLLQHSIEEKLMSEPMKADEPKSQPAPPPSPFIGDGSSPVPGQDKTTLESSGGALVEAKPNYLKNPAPPYPSAARANGWEGLVVLRVSVERSGRAAAVAIESSSGHEVLDAAALRTVRQWRFSPARLGALPVDSAVRVPIRFQLDLKK